MSEAVSRAGWHAQHLRHGQKAVASAPESSTTRGDRARLLKEAMRALDESDVARQAARNPSIVAADTHLNTAYVNDGNGGLRELTKADGVEPVLRYGDARIDAVKRKWHEKSFETTTIISWVPKSLLDEVPDYYPVYSDKKRDPLTGEPLEVGRRSRWVMPQDPARRAEVQRWFEETHRHLTEDVLTGGHDAVHGVVWNFDESAVHVHWMADTLAPLQKDLTVGPDRQMLDADGEPVIRYKRPVTLDKVVTLTADDTVVHAPEIKADQIGGIDRHGYLVDTDGQQLRRTTGERVRASEDLRVEAQQMWGQSSEVTETRVVDGVEKQVKITGATKLSRYQESYREQLVEAGFDIELEVDPEGTSLDKSAFVALESRRTEVSEREQRLIDLADDAERRQRHVAAEMEALERREAEVVEMRATAETILADAERVRADAVETGHKQGYADGLAEVQEKLQEVERQRELAAGDRRAARQVGYEAGHSEGFSAGREAVSAELATARQHREQAEADGRQIAEALTEAQRRRDAVPEYDAVAAVQAMEAARFDAGEKLQIVQRDDAGKIVRDAADRPVMVTVNQELDREAARLYRGRSGEAGLTVGERAKQLKASLREGGAAITKGAEQSKHRGHEGISR